MSVFVITYKQPSEDSEVLAVANTFEIAVSFIHREYPRFKTSDDYPLQPEYFHYYHNEEWNFNYTVGIVEKGLITE